MLPSSNIKNYLPAILAGLIGALGLIFIYWLILSIASKDFWHAFEQFQQFKYWIIALVIGFGIQTGLFWRVRSGATMVAGASTSTITMIACCAHHLVDILPILLSAAALFLSQYQIYFLALGVISNLAGIIFPSISQQAKNIELNIRRKIGGVDREFSWDIK